MRYVIPFKNWCQNRLSISVLTIALLIGIGIGWGILQLTHISLENVGITIATWIGSLLGVGGMFKTYFKEKTEEKKTPKLAFGEVYKRDDNTYFIDVGLISGRGRAQRCAGYITVEYSNINNTSTVWEHSALREYDIGSHMGLRLFRVENSSILFPAALGHMISGFIENSRPLDVFRNKKITVEINFGNGLKPEPYVDRISNIVDNTPLR